MTGLIVASLALLGPNKAGLLAVGMHVLVGPDAASPYEPEHFEPVWRGTIIYVEEYTVDVVPDGKPRDSGYGRNVQKWRVTPITGDK